MNSLPVSNEHIEKMLGRFLSVRSYQELQKMDGVFKNLTIALSEEDLHLIETNEIYFNGFFSPASQNLNSFPLTDNCKIITFDINFFKKEVNSQEAVAILLHEIGHALSPAVKGIDGEYKADDYAVERGHKESILSSLEKFKSLFPVEYNTESTMNRISRLI